MNQSVPKEKEQTGNQQPAKEVSDSAELDVCTTSTTAEHSRGDNEDGPCDDGRAGG